DFNNLLTVILGHSELMLDNLKPGQPLHNHSQQIRKTADRASSLTRQLLAFSRTQAVQSQVLDLNFVIRDMSKLLRRLLREDIESPCPLAARPACLKAAPAQLQQLPQHRPVPPRDPIPAGENLTNKPRNTTPNEDSARLHPPLTPGDYVLLKVSDTGQGMTPE